jgi:hypothetical protein
MRTRKHPLRKQYWVIQLPAEDGSGKLYWSTQGTWFTGDPSEDFGHFDLAVFDSEPDAVALTGYANAVAVPTMDCS